MAAGKRDMKFQEGDYVLLPARGGDPEQKGVVLEVQEQYEGMLLVELLPQYREPGDPDGLREVHSDHVELIDWVN